MKTLNLSDLKTGQKFRFYGGDINAVYEYIGLINGKHNYINTDSKMIVTVQLDRRVLLK